MDSANQGVLNDLVERIVSRFRPEKIILFGSRARGDASPESDMDILIVLDSPGPTRARANEIDMALSDRTYPLDIIVVTPEKFESQKNSIGAVVRQAVLEGRVLYERAA